MKVIISHDIDHLTVKEHLFKDAIVPKFVLRSIIELLNKKISAREYLLRHKTLFENKWQNIEELMSFNKLNQIPATFFIGVNNGLGLAYNIKKAECWIKKIKENGFDIGVHGIAYKDYESIKKEYSDFQKILSQNHFGIRTHYLRKTDKTLNLIEKTGYLFDSSTQEIKSPYKINNLWEFPVHIMDGYVIENRKRWQTQTIEKAKKITLQQIEFIRKQKINYLTIIFHDRYFHDSFFTWKQWYVWLIGYLKNNNFNFTSFAEAIKELENK